MDGSELLRPEEEYIGKRKSISMDKDEDNFRVYDENCTSEIQERVKKTYYEMHTNQTMEFVQKKVKKQDLPQNAIFHFCVKIQILNQNWKCLTNRIFLARKFKYLQPKAIRNLGVKIQTVKKIRHFEQIGHLWRENSNQLMVFLDGKMVEI